MKTFILLALIAATATSCQDLKISLNFSKAESVNFFGPNMKTITFYGFNNSTKKVLENVKAIKKSPIENSRKMPLTLKPME